MPLMTRDEYIASLRRMKRRVYIMGQEVEDPADHPLIRPSLNACAMTYELAQRPEYADLMLATSNLTGQKVNRFTHLYQDAADLIAKVKMLRLLGQVTGCCFQRCVGKDALNALDSVTYDMDKALGTEYHGRFRRYLEHVQEHDLVVDGAMTDPKGDRRLKPSQQTDPDLFVRIVDRRSDGIVVRGAKVHQTGALNSHEIIVMPTQTLTEDDQSYAVACAIPTDAPGILMVVGRQASDTRRLEGGHVDVGNREFGGHEAVIILDDVFVPWGAGLHGW
jgi:4-hydroxybutyryl-CoA dehydratase/vinylacetyl-CoA-Delta-isomerase